MLCELNFYEIDTEQQQQQQQNDDDNSSTTLIIDIRSQREENKNPIIKSPSRTAYLLTFWIISFIMEEIRQVDKIKLFYAKKIFFVKIDQLCY